MAQQNGRNSILEIWDSGGTSRNVSGDLNNVTLTYTRDNPDVTTLGDDSIQRISGLRDATLAVTSIWNSGAANIVDNIDDLITGSTIALVKWYPGGKITGSPFWTGCFLLSSYEETGPANGPVGLSFAMQLASGSLSASTV